MDPCCGSGTVPVAAMELGRRAIACEISPSVHRTAVERVLRAGRADATKSTVDTPHIELRGEKPS